MVNMMGTGKTRKCGFFDNLCIFLKCQNQSTLVNVNWAGDTVTSPVSADVTDRTTSEAGWAPRTAVNVAVVPVSDTVAVLPDRVNAAVSSSEVVTDTVESATESYASADEASTTATVTVVV